MPPLSDKIALVTGATRGAGRGIACMLGEAGATVYCTGRSTRAAPASPRRPETIEETAELVVARGGRGIAVAVDHTQSEQVRALIDRIATEQGRLDLLVNNIWWGADDVEWASRSGRCRSNEACSCSSAEYTLISSPATTPYRC